MSNQDPKKPPLFSQWTGFSLFMAGIFFIGNVFRGIFMADSSSRASDGVFGVTLIILGSWLVSRSQEDPDASPRPKRLTAVPEYNCFATELAELQDHWPSLSLDERNIRLASLSRGFCALVSRDSNTYRGRQIPNHRRILREDFEKQLHLLILSP